MRLITILFVSLVIVTQQQETFFTSKSQFCTGLYLAVWQFFKTQKAWKCTVETSRRWNTSEAPVWLHLCQKLLWIEDVFSGLKVKVSLLRWISAQQCNRQFLRLEGRAAESPAAISLAHFYSYVKATNRCSVTSLNASKLYRWPTFPPHHCDSSEPLKNRLI